MIERTPGNSPDGFTAAPVREQAFIDWCERENYADDDRDAPHASAFFAGYDAGYTEGFEDGHDLGGRSMARNEWLPRRRNVNA